MNWLWLPALLAASIHPLVDAEDKQRLDAPVLAQSMASKDARVRARVAIAYSRMQKRKALGPLLKLSADAAGKVRAAAAFGLGQIAWQVKLTPAESKTAVGRLRALLLDADAAVKKRAIEALGKHAPAGIVGWLHPLLTHEDPGIQAEALRALFRSQRLLRRRQPKKKHAPIDAKVLATLTRLAASKDAQVRQNVAYYFARIKDPRAVDILLGLAKDSAVWVRYFALFALRKLKPAKALPAILASSTHNSYIVRVAAIQAATAQKAGGKLPFVLQHDPSYHVRAAYARAVAHRGHHFWMSWWKREPSLSVKAAILRAWTRRLARRQKSWAQELLRHALTHRSWVVRSAALSASKALGPSRQKLLLGALKDRDFRVQAAAIYGLRGIKGKAAFAAIVKALGSKQLSVRGSAVLALLKRKEAGIPAAIWRCYRQSLSRKWIELREEMVSILAKRKSKTTTGYLAKMVKDPAPSVSNKARSALQKRGVKVSAARAAAARTYSPHRALQFKRDPVVVLVTNRGAIEITCAANAAPIHVANFVGRVKKGLYNGLIWHRVISNFVIQGGDPDGSGWGDGGYLLRAEINRIRYQAGTLGMPRAQGWNTGSVQIFITHTPTPHLDGRYTVFGQVTRGMSVVDQIEKGDRILRAYVKKQAAKGPTRKRAAKGISTAKPTPAKKSPAPPSPAPRKASPAPHKALKDPRKASKAPARRAPTRRSSSPKRKAPPSRRTSK